jgi:hypothetical protein
MATEIYNEGPCFRIVKNGQEFLVTKVQIKRIDTLRGSLVRIDNGEGALKHIYLDFEDVTVPQTFPDVIALRDLLLGWMRQSGVSKEVKQDIEINQLQLIRQAIENLSLGGGVKSSGIMEPLREDESQPNIVYKGYAAPDAQTYDAVWAIVRISRIEDQIIYEWADGNQLYDNIWEQRYKINYSAGVKGPRE